MDIQDKEFKPEDFLKLYDELVKKTGYMIQAHPEFKFRDDGTWSIIVLQTIEKLPVERK